ncbi:hypothetical protein NPIL_5491 [Nephila pilipes]|uniref:Uncharacterized protein n=1 Tax=Nephila pilipes TaxID=299642 RepID=A0A8X6QSE5_NEPPI|nr:hypothetical protein NPIL_5491 [Nephila pilipes]
MTLDRLCVRIPIPAKHVKVDLEQILSNIPLSPLLKGAINKPQRVTQQPTESSSPDHPLTAQTSTSTRTLGESVERSWSILSLSVPLDKISFARGTRFAVPEEFDFVLVSKFSPA